MENGIFEIILLGSYSVSPPVEELFISRHEIINHLWTLLGYYHTINKVLSHFDSAFYICLFVFPELGLDTTKQTNNSRVFLDFRAIIVRC